MKETNWTHQILCSKTQGSRSRYGQICPKVQFLAL